jgi:methylated-DNA-[protein]-cysteine S-methyltransferase
MRHEAAVIFNTVCGWAGAAVSDEGILRITLPVRGKKIVERELRSAGLTICATLPLAGRGLEKKPAVLFKTVKLLRKFFAGEPVSFDLPLDLRYYTAFQRAVWKATASIPYGETRSYAWIAKRTGRPKAARAVGQALGANPVPILIP